LSGGSPSLAMVTFSPSSREISSIEPGGGSVLTCLVRGPFAID
jgi:hypothetical protein